MNKKALVSLIVMGLILFTAAVFTTSYFKFNSFFSKDITNNNSEEVIVLPDDAKPIINEDIENSIITNSTNKTKE